MDRCRSFLTQNAPTAAAAVRWRDWFCKTMKHKITIEFDDEADAITAGLRQNWVDGEDTRTRINLSCGAGTGSPFMVFSLTDKKSGDTRYAVADIRPAVQTLARLLQNTERSHGSL
jgi:hypothetical protein